MRSEHQSGEPKPGLAPRDILTPDSILNCDNQSSSQIIGPILGHPGFVRDLDEMAALTSKAQVRFKFNVLPAGFGRPAPRPAMMYRSS